MKLEPVSLNVPITSDEPRETPDHLDLEKDERRGRSLRERVGPATPPQPPR